MYNCFIVTVFLSAVCIFVNHITTYILLFLMIEVIIVDCIKFLKKLLNLFTFIRTCLNNNTIEI